jgi:hypothetical protein
MKTTDLTLIEKAKASALEVLLHNAKGRHGLPRTAGWGYHEPYTRDLMISMLGIAVSDNQLLMDSMRKTLLKLAENQTERGHIPSLVDVAGDRGASDTTPLFLLAVGIFRQVTKDSSFLEAAVGKAFTWMAYQSPSDDYLIAQQPTSDWRDEQWVMGYGLYVNTLAYACLRLFEHDAHADAMRAAMSHFTVTGDVKHRHVHEGLVVKHKPYYALWSYKLYSSERFDLLGNSLAILSGMAPPTRTDEIVSWVEAECERLRQTGDLVGELPPNFFPYIQPADKDWRERYARYNLPGDYHNGGIWPFIAGFYVAALVAAKRFKLAEEKLLALTKLNTPVRTDKPLAFGFNEWIKAQDGRPMGQDWQTWSAAMYLYAAKCVETRKTPFLDVLRTQQ